MRILIPMKNPATGEVKKVKLGFSWLLLFWSNAFGLPLFLRKLQIWGGFMLVLVVANIWLIKDDIGWFTAITIWGASFWLGFKGNELTAKNYMELGWEFAEQDSEFTRLAKQRWHIA